MRRDQGRRIADFVRRQSGDSTRLVTGMATRPTTIPATPAPACRAGAKIVKPAQDTFYGGYAGYFRDPSGHLWEVVWNPANIPGEA